MKSEERRVKNPCAKVMLASIINKTNVPADLQSAGIEYKDFQSDYFLLLIYRYVFRITDPDTLCCRIAYPTEH